MNANLSPPIIERLVDPLSQCLTPESAERLLAYRADPQLQAVVDQLAEKCNEGTLTQKEEADYASYVAFSTFLALLKSKARQLLAEQSAERALARSPYPFLR